MGKDHRDGDNILTFTVMVCRYRILGMFILGIFGYFTVFLGIFGYVYLDLATVSFIDVFEIGSTID